MPLTARTDASTATPDRRRLPADVRRTLHEAAIAHVADAADAVSRAARAAAEEPEAFAEVREELERRLMRLRLVETDMPLATADVDELARYAVESLTNDLRLLLEQPEVRFERVAAIAEAAHEVAELRRSRAGTVAASAAAAATAAVTAAPREGAPRVARRGGGMP